MKLRDFSSIFHENLGRCRIGPHACGSYQGFKRGNGCARGRAPRGLREASLRNTLHFDIIERGRLERFEFEGGRVYQTALAANFENR